MYHSLAVEMRVNKPKEVPRGVYKCVHCVCLSPGTATWPGHTGDEVEGEKEEEGKEEEIKEDEKVEDERRRGERRLLCMYMYVRTWQCRKGFESETRMDMTIPTNLPQSTLSHSAS